MRINKLFIAKANAAKILKALLFLKIDLRKEEAMNDQEVVK